MNYWRVYLCGVFSCLFCFCASTPAIAFDGDFNNPSFELFDYNELLDFNTPIGWEWTNDTRVMKHFIERDSYWKIPQTGLYPYDGNSFIILSSVDGGENFSEIRQEITVNVGDRITGAYFFGTTDYNNSTNDNRFDDKAYIQLVQPGTNIVEVNIVKISVFDVNNHSSMRGWKRFDYVFNANQIGTYDLKIIVSDEFDTALASYFAVDGLVICPNSPIYGDINADCIVNTLDFVMLAEDWMCDCSDSNTFNDPNRNCVYGTDLDDSSNIINFNDLQVMLDYWLISTIQGIIEE